MYVDAFHVLFLFICNFNDKQKSTIDYRKLIYILITMFLSIIYYFIITCLIILIPYYAWTIFCLNYQLQCLYKCKASNKMSWTKTIQFWWCALICAKKIRNFYWLYLYIPDISLFFTQKYNIVIGAKLLIVQREDGVMFLSKICLWILCALANNLKYWLQL